MANTIILIPKRADWKKLKTVCGVPDGAAKGVNMSDLIDKLHKAYDTAMTAPERVKALQPLSAQLADYIKNMLAAVVRHVHLAIEKVNELAREQKLL